ncbi:MAG: hypothetical protein AAB886_02210 [Patescibacteria group bacterium]|mgnify:CR=1 FL=1
MPIQIHQQIFETINRATRPIIVLPHGAGIDGYSSAFALAKVLEKLEKRAEIVAADGPRPHTLRFLKDDMRVRGSFGSLRKFVVNVNTETALLEELSYSAEPNKLSIFLTPKNGFWTEKDVSFQTGDYRFDLIIALGAPSFDAFGALFSSNTDFWYATPVVNIDHAVGNEHFGQMNAVDITATSVAESLFGLFEKWNVAFTDEEISTILLAGMMAKTQSFKTGVVTPRALQIAGTLVARGARRADIVNHLFRTRSVQTLRLWGRVLARLKFDPSSKVVWSMLSAADFIHAGAGEDELPDVIDELISHAPEADVMVLLYENKERHVCGIISAGRAMDSVELALPFKPVGTRQTAKICLTDSSLAKAEEEIVNRIIERAKKLRAGAVS